MRGLIKRLGEWLADETGQMLVWVLIVTVTGGLIIGAFLAYASASLLTTASQGDQLLLYYTADAGAERCLVSLTVGAANCNNLSVSLNGYTSTVTISGPLTVTSPISATSAPRYLATGLEGNTLAAGSAWLLELNSRPVTIQVNWPFTPAPNAWEIWVYEGSGTGGTVVGSITGTASPAGIEVPIVTDTVYTIRFLNSSATGTVAESFVVSPTPVLSYTWVYANAYQDYIITSTVGETVLEVIARQTPGSSLITNPITVTGASWQLR